MFQCIIVSSLDSLRACVLCIMKSQFYIKKASNNYISPHQSCYELPLSRLGVFNPYAADNTLECGWRFEHSNQNISHGAARNNFFKNLIALDLNRIQLSTIAFTQWIHLSYLINVCIWFISETYNFDTWKHWSHRELTGPTES